MLGAIGVGSAPHVWMVTRLKVRVFIDYWNFQLNWNERAGEARCDWLALPWALLRATGKLLRCNGLEYEGTHLYAAVDPANDNLQGWLSSFLDRQPGFMVHTSRMVRRQRPVRCTACGTEAERCEACGEPFNIGSAKGLTSKMVVDMLRLCGSGACDVPIVVSSDTELGPALEALLGDGVKVVHAGWRENGGEVSRMAWAAVDLDELMGELVRT